MPLRLSLLVLVGSLLLPACGDSGGSDPTDGGGTPDTSVADGGAVDAPATADSAVTVDAASSDPYVRCNVTTVPPIACDITNGVACDELHAAGAMCSAGTTSPTRCPTMKGTKVLVGICVASNGNLVRFSYAEPAAQTAAANSANTGCMTSPGFQRFCRLVP